MQNANLTRLGYFQGGCGNYVRSGVQNQCDEKPHSLKGRSIHRKVEEKLKGAKRFPSLRTYFSQIEKSIISRPKPTIKSKSIPRVSSKSSGCWKSNNEYKTTQITLPNNTRSSESLLPHPLSHMSNSRYTIPQKKNPPVSSFPIQRANPGTQCSRMKGRRQSPAGG